MLTLETLTRWTNATAALLHYQEGTSNKVYIPVVFPLSDTEWESGAFYGRVGNALQYTRKCVSRAIPSVQNMIHTKEAKGYSLIDGMSGLSVSLLIAAYRKGERYSQPSEYFTEPLNEQFRHDDQMLDLRNISIEHPQAGEYWMTPKSTRDLYYGAWDGTAFHVSFDTSFVRLSVSHPTAPTWQGNPFPEVDQPYVFLLGNPHSPKIVGILRLGEELPPSIEVENSWLLALEALGLPVMAYEHFTQPASAEPGCLVRQEQNGTWEIFRTHQRTVS